VAHAIAAADGFRSAQELHAPCAAPERQSGSPPSTAPCKRSPTPVRSTPYALREVRRSTAAAPPATITTWSAGTAAIPSRWPARRSNAGRSGWPPNTASGTSPTR